MNGQLYAFALPALVASWDLSLAAAGASGTAGLAGMACGHFIHPGVAARVAPARTFRFAISWLATFSLASAFAQDQAQLLLLRWATGLGIGLALAAGELLLRSGDPTVGDGHRSPLAVGSAVACGAAVAIFMAVHLTTDAEMAWRLLFIAGALPAVLALMRVQSACTMGLPRGGGRVRAHRAPFCRPPRWTAVLNGMLAAGIQGGRLTVVAWLPACLMLERGSGIAWTGLSVLAVALGGLAGAGVGARIVGAAYPCIALGVLLVGALAVMSALGFGVVRSPWLPALGFALGLSLLAAQRAMAAVLVPSGPSPCLTARLSPSVQLGSAAGLLGPVLVSACSDVIGLGRSIAISGSAGVVVALVATALLPRAGTSSFSTGVAR